MPTQLKQPLGKTLNTFAEKKIADAAQLVGKALPCTVTAVSGAIVTVAFDVVSGFTLPPVKVPVANPIYCRYPIQVGDLGVVVAADTYLGGVSGLGGGTASLTPRANLATLLFVPVGNTNWAPVNGQQLYLQGPGGVVVQNMTGSAAVISITAGQISLSAGGKSILIDSAGVTIDGILFDSHEHTGVQVGGGTSGPPVGGSGGGGGASNGTVTNTLPAGATILAYQAVGQNSSGSLVVASADTYADASSYIGIATQAGSSGASLGVTNFGPVVNSSWAWTAGQPVFLGLAGALTQTAPTSGILLQVGVASSTTQINLSSSFPIQL